MTYSIAELKKEYDSIAIDEATPEIKNAIEKLKAESAENAVDLIRMMLVLTLVNGDNQLAEKINSSKYKSLAQCFSHIRDWAKAKATKGCAVIDHEDVLSEAIHYYVDMEDKAPQSPKQNTAISKPKSAPSLFEENQSTKKSTTTLSNALIIPKKHPNSSAQASKPSQKATEANSLISLF